jgi:hypothetical protein
MTSLALVLGSAVSPARKSVVTNNLLVIAGWRHYDVIMTQRRSGTTAKRKPVAARVAVTMRLPQNIVEQIDSALERRVIPLSRNNWLLEAAIEKLERSRPEGSNGAR